MIPHGNCRDASKSGRIVNEDKAVAPRHDYIMREFILNDDFIDNRREERPARTRKSPGDHILKILLGRQLLHDIRESVSRKTGMVHDTHRCINK